MDTGNLNVIVGDRCVSLSLWDTVGNTEYDGLRPLAYPKTVRIDDILYLRKAVSINAHKPNRFGTKLCVRNRQAVDIKKTIKKNKYFFLWDFMKNSIYAGFRLINDSCSDNFYCV